MTKIISISCSEEFDILRKNNNISPSEAYRIGLSILLSEKGIIKYDNSINIIRKISILSDILNIEMKKKEELEKHLSEIKKSSDKS